MTTPTTTDTEAGPVPLEPPSRLSMSFLRAAGDECMQKAVWAREFDQSGEPAIIGRLFHDAAAAIGLYATLNGLARIDPEPAERVARQVLRTPEDADRLPRDAYEEVLDLVARWVTRAVFPPNAEHEVSSRVTIAERVHSARLDVVSFEAGVVTVRDYKTGWTPPASTDTATQGHVYAVHALAMHPDAVAVQWIPDFVRFDFDSPSTITPDEVEMTVEWMAAGAARIDAAYRAGKFPAEPGRWCASCPRSLECPVPEQARPAAFVTDEDAAREQMDALLVEERRIVERKQAIRGYLEANDQRAFDHNGEQIGWSDKPGSRLDAKAAKAAGFDPASFRVPTTPSFGRRKTA